MFEMLGSLNIIGQIIIGTILLILILSLSFAFSVKSKYKKLSADVLDKKNREGMIFDNAVNNHIVEDYNRALDAHIKEINTLAILEKNISVSLKKSLTKERFVEKSSSLMIILGLIGTFFGLTLSITELVSLLSQTGTAVVGDVNTITDGLLNSISGMSVAFVTSLFGITASIIITITAIILGGREAKDEYFSIVEEYLDNVIGRKSAELTDISSNGKTPLENSFDKLSNDLTESIKEVTSTLSYRLTVASNNMTETAESIQGSMSKFDNSIKDFSDNSRDFSEFNHHLKTNIERMSVAFDDLTEGLKASEVRR